MLPNYNFGSIFRILTLIGLAKSCYIIKYKIFIGQFFYLFCAGLFNIISIKTF